MGVKGLWKILELVSQKKDIKYFSGSYVAVDISIWIINSISNSQNLTKIKKGRNNYVYSLLKKILVLLENNIKPIFVFDGKTPEIKKKEVLRRIDEKNNKEKNAKILAKSVFNKLLDNKPIEKKNDKNEEEFIEEIFEMLLKDKFEEKNEENNFEYLIIEEFLVILQEKNLLEEKEILILKEKKYIREILYELNKIFNNKINKNFSETENLELILKKFEINQTIKKINKNLKKKLEEKNMEKIIKEEYKININDFEYKNYGKFQNQKEFVILKKKSFYNMEKDMKMPNMQKHFRKYKNKRREDRMKSILSTFNTLREEAHMKNRYKNHNFISIKNFEEEKFKEEENNCEEKKNNFEEEKNNFEEEENNFKNELNFEEENFFKKNKKDFCKKDKLIDFDNILMDDDKYNGDNYDDELVLEKLYSKLNFSKKEIEKNDLKAEKNIEKEIKKYKKNEKIIKEKEQKTINTQEQIKKLIKKEEKKNKKICYNKTLKKKNKKK